jgi:hypothetical protein
LKIAVIELGGIYRLLERRVIMSDEIDISKLHGDIKLYAQKADKDNQGSKGSGKLNTLYEINLFKEMVRRNGKEAELIKQVPNIKGITVPVKHKDINKRIVDLMKEDNTEENKTELKDTVSEKLET